MNNILILGYDIQNSFDKFRQNENKSKTVNSESDAENLMRTLNYEDHGAFFYSFKGRRRRLLKMTSKNGGKCWAKFPRSMKTFKFRMKM